MSVGGASSGDPGSAPPFVEYVKDIGLAEIHPHRTPAGAFAIVAFEVAVDAAERDLQRHACASPARDQLEARSDDTNQVPVVLPTEIRFNLAGSSLRCPRGSATRGSRFQVLFLGSRFWVLGLRFAICDSGHGF